MGAAIKAIEKSLGDIPRKPYEPKPKSWGEYISVCGPSCADLGISMDELRMFALVEVDWQNVTGVITGLNPGWDHAMANTALDAGLDLVVVVPELAWHKRWSKPVQSKCEVLLERARVVVSMIDRVEQNANTYLAHISDRLVGLWPEGAGVAGSRIWAAQERGLQVTNLWEGAEERGWGGNG